MHSASSEIGCVVVKLGINRSRKNGAYMDSCAHKLPTQAFREGDDRMFCGDVRTHVRDPDHA